MFCFNKISPLDIRVSAAEETHEVSERETPELLISIWFQVWSMSNISVCLSSMSTHKTNFGLYLCEKQDLFYLFKDTVSRVIMCSHDEDAHSKCISVEKLFGSLFVSVTFLLS